jgi:integrase
MAGLTGTSPTISPTVLMHFEKRGKSLLVRFSHDGKPYSFSLPKHNNKMGITLAKKLMATIEADILYGDFDRTLLRYKSRKMGKNPTQITAVRLFEKYAADRIQERGLEHSSKDRFKSIASKLSQFLGDRAADKVTESVAKEAISKWSKSANDRTLKERLKDLQSCWNWAKGKYHVAEFNPWSICLDRLKHKGKKIAPNQKKPFTVPELQAIIAAFKIDTYYNHYSDFVIFMANTACRPGEAVGLKWEHIKADYSSAAICESISRGHRNRKGTKTSKSRTIQLSPSLQSMLSERFDCLKPKPGDLVFPAPKGGSINDNNFAKRAWEKILSLCDVEYRSPYNLRHTAISHALARGVNPVDLAEQTGHSVRVLLERYAHAIEQKCVLVDFLDEDYRI